jgi:hypothetical protein
VIVAMVWAVAEVLESVLDWPTAKASDWVWAVVPEAPIRLRCMASFTPAPVPVPMPALRVPLAPATLESVPPRDDSPIVMVLATGVALFDRPRRSEAAAIRAICKSLPATPGSALEDQPRVILAAKSWEIAFVFIPQTGLPAPTPQMRVAEPAKSIAMPVVGWVATNNEGTVREPGRPTVDVLVTVVPIPPSVRDGRDEPPPPPPINPLREPAI